MIHTKLRGFPCNPTIASTIRILALGDGIRHQLNARLARRVRVGRFV